MNKKNFNEIMKNALKNMSSKDIEKAVTALTELKAKAIVEKKEEDAGLAKLLKDIKPKRKTITFKKINGECGKIRVLGASLITSNDYAACRWQIPKVDEEWWTFNRTQIFQTGMEQYIYSHIRKGYVRPVLLVENRKEAELRVGDDFFIKGNRFRVISDCLAIKTKPLEEEKPYDTDNYLESSIAMSIDLWYDELAKKEG